MGNYANLHDALNAYHKKLKEQINDGSIVAGKAVNDGDGNNISTEYAKLNSANTFSQKNEFTGSLTLPNSPDNPKTKDVIGRYTSRQTANADTSNLTVVDGEATTVTKIQGATVATTNLIDVTAETQTVSGVTFTKNADNSFTVKGTATGTIYQLIGKVRNLPSGNYTLSGMPSTSSRSTYYAYGEYRDENNVLQYVNNDNVVGVLTKKSTSTVNIFIYIASGQTVNFTAYLMLNSGTTAKPYRPYFSGLKNAYFKGIRSTGKNLYNGEQNITVRKGYAFSIFNGYIIGKVYFKCKFDGTSEALGTQLISIIQANDTETVILANEMNNIKTISNGVKSIRISNWSRTNGTLTDIMLSYNKEDEYEPYKADESFMLDEAVDLAKWDYIDTERGKVVRATRVLTFKGSTNFVQTNANTVNGLYDYKFTYGHENYIGKGYSAVVKSRPTDFSVAQSGGTTSLSIMVFNNTPYATAEEFNAHLAENPLQVAYQLFNATETDLAIPTDKYQSWVHGSETQEQGDKDNSADGAVCEITQTYSIHDNPTEAATHAYVQNGLAKKLDKTGGTVYGSLLVEGSTDTTLSALVVKNNDATYGLAYEGDSYKLGQGTVDENNNFSFDEGEGLPIALRADSSTFKDGNVVAWSANGNKLVDGDVALKKANHENYYNIMRNLVAVWGDNEGKIIIIPEGTKTVEGYTDNSTIVTAVIPYGVTTIGSSAFSNCDSLTSVTIPNSVTTIGDYAFHNCNILKSVTIPNSVTTIGTAAFAACYGLTSVTISNSVTTIGEFAFSGCESLTSVTIPNGVTTIGKSAFHGCDSLTSVTIPNSVTTIGQSAFAECKMTSITIPNSVTTIEYLAFGACLSLTSVTMKRETPPTLGTSVFYNSTALKKIYVPYGCGNAYKSATNWSEHAGLIEELPQ